MSSTTTKASPRRPIPAMQPERQRAPNEGGGGWMRQGKYLVLAMQASEKTYMDYALRVTDKGGHSSLPTPENAIYRLSAGRLRVQKLVFPVELNEVLVVLQSLLLETSLPPSSP